MYISIYTSEARWKSFVKKKNCNFVESFFDKTTFNFHSFNKINDIATSQYATTIFYSLYLNPSS